MKKTAKKKASAKKTLKEVPRENRLLKKFTLSMQVDGDMMDKDTPISEAALAAYFEMRYACPKGIKISRIEVKEIKEPVVIAPEATPTAPPSLEEAPATAGVPSETPIPPQVPGN